MIEVPVISSIARGGASIASVGVHPSWAQGFLRFLPWNLLGLFDQIKFSKLTAATIDARLTNGLQGDLEDGFVGVDLIDKLLEVRNEDGSPLSRDEVNAEAILLLIAGSDTTSK